MRETILGGPEHVPRDPVRRFKARAARREATHGSPMSSGVTTGGSNSSTLRTVPLLTRSGWPREKSTAGGADEVLAACFADRQDDAAGLREALADDCPVSTSGVLPGECSDSRVCDRRRDQLGEVASRHQPELVGVLAVPSGRELERCHRNLPKQVGERWGLGLSVGGHPAGGPPPQGTWLATAHHSR